MGCDRLADAKQAAGPENAQPREMGDRLPSHGCSCKPRGQGWLILPHGCSGQQVCDVAGPHQQLRTCCCLAWRLPGQFWQQRAGQSQWHSRELRGSRAAPARAGQLSTGTVMGRDSAAQAAASLSSGPPVRWSPASGPLHPRGDRLARNGAGAPCEPSMNGSGGAGEGTAPGCHFASQAWQKHPHNLSEL